MRLIFVILSINTLGLFVALAQPEKANSVFHLMLEIVGKEVDLQNLTTFSIEVSGERKIDAESFSADGNFSAASTFNYTLNYNVASDSFRIDYIHQSRTGATLEFSEIISGELGYIDGSDSAFGGPSTRGMTSDRLAATRKQLLLTNPHLFLIKALNSGSFLVQDQSFSNLNKQGQFSLTFAGEGAPITVYLTTSGKIIKLETIENNHLTRDTKLEVFYENWQRVGALNLPRKVTIMLDGQLTYEENRQAIRVNEKLDSSLFAYSFDALPAFDAELANRGKLNSQSHQAFAALGFPNSIDGLQITVDAQELATGVFLLAGGSHNSLAIEQEKGIVIVEAPLYPERSEAVIAWVEQTFPDKPITHVISSHHHRDHSSGLRSYVARGVRVVLGKAGKAFLNKAFTAPSTVLPDALAENPQFPKITSLSNTIDFPDSLRRIEVHPIETQHAEDMVVTYLPSAGILFVADIYSPNGTSGSPPLEISDFLDSTNIPVSLFVGGHGNTATFEEYQSLFK